MQVFTAQQMRDFDRAATEKYGIPSIVLMENAALRVVEFLEMKFAPLHDKKIVVLCGKGNNGGDGFAIARHLLSLCHNLNILVAADPNGLKGDAAINRDILLKLLSNYQNRDGYGDVEKNLEQIERADIVLDALLGTGFHGSISDSKLLQALKELKSTKAVCIGVDIPSALNSDTGTAAPEAVPAHYTVTFAAPKAGLFLSDGVNLCGEVWVGDIGTGSKAIEQVDTGCQCITQAYAHSLLPQRPIDTHKGDAGRVVLCGGSYGMSGAPTLAAKASLSAGAGLCIACLPDKILPLFASAFSEATSHPLPCNDEGQLIETAADDMSDYWKEAHVVGLGPGLSRGEGALNFARRVMRECPHPLLIDADALYAVRAVQANLQNRQAPNILTPHPGEMGELMEMKTADVQADRLGIAQECAKKYNAIVVLKGARSIVALPNGRTFFNLTGNSGMATGGSGDVLTGTICGLLAQLKDAEQATLLGVYLHGLAGDIAYRSKGNGLIAGDIAANLPHALLELQKPPEQPTNSRLIKLQ